MLRRLGLIAALCAAAQAAAADKIIQNDTFTGSGTVNSGVSFGEYQGAGVLFTPAPGDYPLKIVAIDVFSVTYNGGAPGNYGAYVVSLWNESQGTLNPPRLFDGGSYVPQVNQLGAQFLTSNTMLNRFTLPSPFVVDAGQVFVAVTEQLQTSLDSTTIALDNGPLKPGANYFFNGGGGFEPIDLPDGGRPLGINQNWIIRLVAEGADLPVTVTSITPSSGPDNVGTDVTITGTHFELGAEAFLGANALALRSVTTTTIGATVPAGLSPGLYDVRVRNRNGVEGTLPNGYRVLLADGGTGEDAGTGGGAGGGAGGGTGGGTGGGGMSGQLTVATVTPTEMFAEDGATLVVTGEGFAPGAQVFIGSTVIEQVDVKSPAVLNVTVAKNAVAKGLYDVSVLNLSGQRATLPMALTVYAGTSVKPGCGCTAVEPMTLWGVALALTVLRRRRR
ncbi:MAG: IPT/TIG domain-containing protein [Myxococcota bacterium]